jgi:hypothetical protein
MLDTAGAAIEYPDLSHRVGDKGAEGGQQTSTFARLFGWGAAT